LGRSGKQNTTYLAAAQHLNDWPQKVELDEMPEVEFVLGGYNRSHELDGRELKVSVAGGFHQAQRQVDGTVTHDEVFHAV